VIEGRPGSQPDPHPPKESGQGSPEPVRTAEVRQRCDTQQVNLMARRERHPVAAESDTPLLIPGVEPPSCITRVGITTEKVKPRASLLPNVISIPFLPGSRQVMRERQTPDRQSLV